MMKKIIKKIDKGIIEDIIAKIQARQDQVDKLLASLQTALDNANKTMDDIKATLELAKIAIGEVNDSVNTLRADYAAFKKTVEDYITAHSGNPSTKKHWPF